MTRELVSPPEPVVHEDGTVEVLYVDGQPATVQSVELGTWVCQRCNTQTYTGVADGQIQDPHECDGCERQGPFVHAGDFDTDEVQAALRAEDMWHPPSGVSEEGYGDLWDNVRAFLREYWDASEPEIYDGLTAYALSTWVRENLTFVPHLMLMGKTTGGKTRLLNTLARVSYRAIVTSSATPASMFRLIDAYDVSYYISEYHGLSHEAQRELDNVVRAGQKRGEVVTRAEPSSDGFEPMVFNPFAHVAVATQFTPADDIVNRCIQVRSSPADRDMPATLDEDRAETLRNRLLFARYYLLNSDTWADAEADAYAHLEEHGIDGRTREKLLGLLTVAYVWDRVDAFTPFIDTAVQQDREAAADSEDALFIEALKDLALEEIGSTVVLGDGDPFAAVEVPLTDVAEKHEDLTGTEKSPSWAGHVRSRLGFEKDRRSDGTVISDPDLGPKLRELCEEMNLDWERLDTHAAVEELPENEQGKGASGCSLCGRDRFLTHRDLKDGGRICDDCAGDLEGAA